MTGSRAENESSFQGARVRAPALISWRPYTDLLNYYARGLLIVGSGRHEPFISGRADHVLNTHNLCELCIESGL